MNHLPHLQLKNIHFLHDLCLMSDDELLVNVNTRFPGNPCINSNDTRFLLDKLGYRDHPTLTMTVRQTIGYQVTRWLSFVPEEMDSVELKLLAPWTADKRLELFFNMSNSAYRRMDLCHDRLAWVRMVPRFEEFITSALYNETCKPLTYTMDNGGPKVKETREEFLNHLRGFFGTTIRSAWIIQRLKELQT